MHFKNCIIYVTATQTTSNDGNVVGSFKNKGHLCNKLYRACLSIRVALCLHRKYLNLVQLQTKFSYGKMARFADFLIFFFADLKNYYARKNFVFEHVHKEARVPPNKT